MKAVMVMFDTLTRDCVAPYGAPREATPNFARLAERCCTFDRFYGGSMPCMPARRELHTGMYNFLHRSWGPLEPFDFSCFQALSDSGVYTHLVSDHSHYWEDGGATYHNRYSSWEGFRGQEGDRWAPRDIIADLPDGLSPLQKTKGPSPLQHEANKRRQATEGEMSGARTVKAGLDFIRTHADRDNWLLQIECFDPHEPFYVPQKYRERFGLPERVRLNWPAYAAVDADAHAEELDECRREYAALISMCDDHLGRVLDLFDAYGLWDDTLLIVNTDHGFLLGEHNYLGKNFWPMHQEIIHLPFFMHVPGCAAGERRAQLCQTVDIAPTLLDWFGIAAPDDVAGAMDGRSLLPVAVAADAPAPHAYALFGAHGNHVCVTDGDYVYMRAAAREDNEPFVECTLMPTNIRGFFSSEQLCAAELVPGDRYSHGLPYLKMRSRTYMNSHTFGSSLWDVRAGEERIEDDAIEQRLMNAMKELMERCEAPAEEFERLGLGLPAVAV